MKTLPYRAIVLVALGLAACATGEAVTGDAEQIFGTGGVDASAPAHSAGAGGDEGASPSCGPGEKACGRNCEPIAPLVGCGATNCMPCSPPPNAKSVCNGDACGFECDPGFSLGAGNSCKPGVGSAGSSSSSSGGGNGVGAATGDGGEAGAGGRGSGGTGSSSGGAPSGGSSAGGVEGSGGAASGGVQGSGGAASGGRGSGGLASGGAVGSGGATQCVASQCPGCLLLMPACCWMGGTSCGCLDAARNCLAPLGPPGM